MNKGMNVECRFFLVVILHQMIKSTNVCYHVVGFSWGQLSVGHYVSEAYGVKV